MKILLVNLREPFKETQKPVFVPPMGLWTLRTFIELNKKIKVDICDEHIGDKIDYFLGNKYDIVGISARFSIQYKEYTRVSKLLRLNYPNVKIIAGGFHATHAQKPNEIDEVVLGDGETYFSRLFDIELNSFDDIPFPRFKKQDLGKYLKEQRPHALESKTKKWIPIETSRGCNKSCGFCGIPGFWGKWKGHSIEWLEKHFKYLNKKQIQEVFIEDDNMIIDKQRFIKMVESLKKHNLFWSTPNGIQANVLFDKEILKTLSNSTCWKLSLPFETGNEKTAKLINIGNKYMPFDRAKELVVILNDIGIKTTGFFIIGYPGENKDDIMRTLDYANALPLTGRHIHVATPYPGTPLYDICKENKFLVSEGEEFYEHLLFTQGLIKTKDFSPEEIFDIKSKDREEAIKRLSLKEKNKND